MKTGFGSVEAAIEQQKSMGGGGGEFFIPGIFWKENEVRVLRFLTDDVLSADFYDFVPCDDGRNREFIAPDSLESDEPDYILEKNIYLPNFKKELVPPKAKPKTAGLAIVREEFKGQDGKTSVRDMIVERDWTDKDGTEHHESGPLIGVVKQSNSNFWPSLIAFYNRYGTICDRDYVVERRGKFKDTAYSFIPLDPIEGLRTPEEIAAAYKPEVSLKDWATHLASYERAEALLSGKAAGGKAEVKAPVTEPHSAPADVAPATGTRFSSLTSQLEGNK